VEVGFTVIGLKNVDLFNEEVDVFRPIEEAIIRPTDGDPPPRRENHVLIGLESQRQRKTRWISLAPDKPTLQIAGGVVPDPSAFQSQLGDAVKESDLSFCRMTVILPILDPDFIKAEPRRNAAGSTKGDEQNGFVITQPCAGLEDDGSFERRGVSFVDLVADKFEESFCHSGGLGQTGCQFAGLRHDKEMVGIDVFPGFKKAISIFSFECHKNSEKDRQSTHPKHLVH